MDDAELRRAQTQLERSVIAAVCSEFAENVVNVILHCSSLDPEPNRNLLVRQALLEVFRDLQLPWAKRGGNARRRQRLPHRVDPPHERRHNVRWARELPSKRRPDSFEQLLTAGIVGDNPCESALKESEDLGFGFSAVQGDDGRRGRRRVRLAHEGNKTLIREVHEEDLGARVVEPLEALRVPVTQIKRYKARLTLERSQNRLAVVTRVDHDTHRCG